MSPIKAETASSAFIDRDCGNSVTICSVACDIAFMWAEIRSPMRFIPPGKVAKQVDSEKKQVTMVGQRPFTFMRVDDVRK